MKGRESRRRRPARPAAHVIGIRDEEGRAFRVPEGLLQDGVRDVVAAPRGSEPCDQGVVPRELGGFRRFRFHRLRRILETAREFHRVGLRVERLERVLEDLGLHPAGGDRERSGS